MSSFLEPNEDFSFSDNYAGSGINKISENLKLDYKTVRHHLKVLVRNNLIYAIEKDKYGAVYFPSEMMNNNKMMFIEIWDKIGTNLGKS